MELTWWGTAGFKIKTAGSTVLLDPYLSRNSEAKPEQYLNPEDIRECDFVFISHGHFDHIYDLPAILKSNKARVYCSREVKDQLIEADIKSDRLYEVTADGFEVEFNGNLAEGFYSQHVSFDRKLIFKTIWQAKFGILKHLHLFKQFPAGQILSWRLTIDDQIIHFFGSAGSPAAEMEKLASRRTDVLLVPLQGHTDICSIALEYVHVMRPQIVIPHLFDNFYPPISSMVDIEPFIKGVKRECPDTEVRVMSINETLVL